MDPRFIRLVLLLYAVAAHSASPKRPPLQKALLLDVIGPEGGRAVSRCNCRPALPDGPQTCGLGSLQISSLAGEPELESAARQHVGPVSARRVAPTAEIPLACAEHLGKNEVAGAWGGELGELLLTLAAFEASAEQQLTSAAVLTTLRAVVDKAKVPIIYHTNVTAELHLCKKLGVGGIDMLLPPPALQPRILEAFSDPDTHGCVLLRSLVRSPGQFGIRPALVQGVIAAFYKLLWTAGDPLRNKLRYYVDADGPAAAAAAAAIVAARGAADDSAAPAASTSSALGENLNIVSVADAAVKPLPPVPENIADPLSVAEALQRGEALLGPLAEIPGTAGLLPYGPFDALMSQPMTRKGKRGPDGRRTKSKRRLPRLRIIGAAKTDPAAPAPAAATGGRGGSDAVPTSAGAPAAAQDASAAPAGSGAEGDSTARFAADSHSGASAAALQQRALAMSVIAAPPPRALLEVTVSPDCWATAKRSVPIAPFVPSFVHAPGPGTPGTSLTGAGTGAGAGGGGVVASSHAPSAFYVLHPQVAAARRAALARLLARVFNGDAELITDAVTARAAQWATAIETELGIGQAAAEAAAADGAAPPRQPLQKVQLVFTK